MESRFADEDEHTMGFSGGSDDKESACSGGDPGSIPGCTIPVTHKQ